MERFGVPRVDGEVTEVAKKANVPPDKLRYTSSPCRMICSSGVGAVPRAQLPQHAVPEAQTDEEGEAALRPRRVSCLVFDVMITATLVHRTLMQTVDERRGGLRFGGDVRGPTHERSGSDEHSAPC